MTTFTSSTPAAREPSPAADSSSLLRVQPDGRAAEIVIDTGMPLRSGKTWQAYAKVYCSDIFHAQMMAKCLSVRIGDAIESARREAYLSGYRDGSRRRRACRTFSRDL
ncbi:MAG: hypothetical protein ACQKBW_05825 [Puniceicoccales bacterium]